MSDPFEEAAKAFYKTTGFLMPGKDGCPRDHEGNLEPEVEEAFKIWCSAVDYMRAQNGSKDKEIKALKEQLTDCDDALLKKGIFREETHALQGTIKELKEQLAKATDPEWNEVSRRNKEILELREQLTRMGEALEVVSDDPKGFEISVVDAALSSYDPKWIAGVRADVWEKAAEIARHYSEGINPHLSDTAEANYYRSIEIADRLKLEAGKSRQPNQSRAVDREESLHEYIERTRKSVESRPKWKRGNG